MSFRTVSADLIGPGTLSQPYALTGRLTLGATNGVRMVLDGTAQALLFYSALSTLIASLAAQAGEDQYDNAFVAGLSVGSPGGPGAVLGFSGSTGLLYFPGVVPDIALDANLQLNHQGTGTAQQSFLTVSPATDNLQLDRVALNLFSSSHDGSARTQIAEAYVDSSGTPHFYRTLDYSAEKVTGLITGVQPGTGTSGANPAVAETWHAVTGGIGYQNSFADFGSSHQTVRYKLDGGNRVWLDGDAKPGTWANGTVIFTVPTGYRPLALRSYIRQTEGVGSGLYSIDVLPNGNVELNDIISTAPAIVDLSGISWPVD